MEGKLAQVGGQSEEKCDPMKFKLGWYFLCTSQPSGDWKSQRQFLDSNHSLGVSISVKSVASKFLQPSKMVDSNIPPNIPNLTSDSSITSRLLWPLQKGKLNISHSTNEFSSVMAAQESGPQMASAIGDLVTYWQHDHVENQYFVSGRWQIWPQQLFTAAAQVPASSSSYATLLIFVRWPMVQLNKNLNSLSIWYTRLYEAYGCRSQVIHIGPHWGKIGA